MTWEELGKKLVKTQETWTPIALVDNAVGNSKTFTVPVNTEYEILSIGAVLVTDATAGNRLLSVTFSTSTSSQTFARHTAGYTVAANLTRVFTFAPGLPKEAAIDLGNRGSIPISRVVLPAGYKILVNDANSISGNDTLNVYMLVRQRSVA